ncbi:MAG: cobalamin-dependent protein [Phycisphaerales bacterium]|jgi:methanogenic corrinoid protein MtbC1
MSEHDGDILAEQLAAEFLRSQNRELAEHATRLMLGRHPEIARRYSPTPHDVWRGSLASRVGELADALSLAAPKLFSSQVAWAKVAFVTRGVPVSDITHSLEAIREAATKLVPQDDLELVQDYIDQAIEALERAPDSPPPEMSLKSPQGQLAAQYLLTLLEGERHKACQMLVDAVPQLSLHEVYGQVIQPVMYELGRMWHLNEVSVAEEHFATAATLMAMSQMLTKLPRKPSKGKTLLAACVEGNAHEIGLRMVSDTFELEGWRVVHLGANVPSEDIPLAARDFQVDVVALSATLHSQLQAMMHAIELVRRTSPPGLKIMVGGVALNQPQTWRQVGADGYARSPQEALDLGTRWCGLATA